METITEAIKTPEISLPSAETNGHSNGTTLQEAVLVEASSVSSALEQKPEPHPLAEYFGKYEGEVWEEFRAIIKRNREQDDKEAAGD